MTEVFYDFDKGSDALKKFNLEYEPDMVVDPGMSSCGMGPIWEMLGVKWFDWPGRPGGNVPNNSGF